MGEGGRDERFWEVRVTEREPPLPSLGPWSLKAVLWLRGARSCCSLAKLLVSLEKESGGSKVTLPAEAS